MIAAMPVKTAAHIHFESLVGIQSRLSPVGLTLSSGCRRGADDPANRAAPAWLGGLRCNRQGPLPLAVPAAAVGSFSAASRTSGRDLRFLEVGSQPERVKRVGELPSPVADQKLEVGDVAIKVRQKIRIWCVACSPSIWNWVLSFPSGSTNQSVRHR